MIYLVKTKYVMVQNNGFWIVWSTESKLCVEQTIDKEHIIFKSIKYIKLFLEQIIFNYHYLILVHLLVTAFHH